MPQRAQIAVNMHDNAEWQIAGEISCIYILNKNEIELPENLNKYERQIFEGLPIKTVIIHC